MFKSNSKYRFNPLYFETIDTPEKAYWIGFIWCDGTNRESGNSFEFKLTLQEEDAEHVSKLKEALEATHPIKVYYSKRANTQPEHRLFISNKVFGNILKEKYNFITHRINTEKLTNAIPEKFLKDFIRGVIDADGGIYASTKTYKHILREEFFFNITSHVTLLEFINRVLINEGLTETVYTISKKRSRKVEHVGQLRIQGNLVCERILSWIYDDASIYLERKKKVVEYMKNYMKDYRIEKGEILDESTII